MISGVLDRSTSRNPRWTLSASARLPDRNRHRVLLSAPRLTSGFPRPASGSGAVAYADRCVPLEQVEEPEDPAPLNGYKVMCFRQPAKAPFPILVIEPTESVFSVHARDVLGYAFEVVELRVGEAGRQQAPVRRSRLFFCAAHGYL